MSLSELSIKRPVFAWMIMLGLIVFGFLCLRQLGVSQMPDVDFPVVSVSASLQGAAPEVMELQVVDPIEDAIMGIAGIKSVNSSARQSSASISVEFELSANIDAALEEVQSRIAQVAHNLPADMDPPTIRKSNPEDQPIIWLLLTTDPSVPRLEQMNYARNVLFDQFSTLDGVGDIGLGGYVDPNLRIWVSEPKLTQYELTADDVVKAIESEHAEIPAGRLENAKHEIPLRLMGLAATPKEFGDIVVIGRGGGANFAPIRLKQIARVEEDLADIRRISRYNGKPAVGLGILKQHGSNAVDVANRVREKLEQIKPTLPPGYSLEVRLDSTRFIKESVAELNFTLLLSALLTSIVCYFFLGSWSSTMNVLLAIPTSIVGAFIGLKLFGFTLNTFTLLGLSLAIGLVVDDAIMMLENIVRRAEGGLPRRRAAIEGANEITFAAIVATIAIVAIFLPVIFVDGIIGRYLYQYGITVTFAVMLSLLEALTLTPMRCSQFLTIGHGNKISQVMDRFMDACARVYRRVLTVLVGGKRWVPVVAVAVAVALFYGSLKVAQKIPGEMVPSQDQSQLMLRIKTKDGASLQFTDAVFKRAEAYLAKMPEVTGVYSSVGGFGGDAVNQGMIYVSFKPPGERKLTQTQLMEKIRKDMREQVKAGKVTVQDMSLRGFSSGRGFPVEFTVQGPDWDKLGELSLSFIDKLNASGIVTDANTDYNTGMPEVHMIPDRVAAAKYAVALDKISQAVNSMVGGVVMNAASRYRKNGHDYDIRLRLEGDERDRMESIGRLKVRNNRGELVPLSKVVELKEEPSLQSISRRNRERAITIHGNIAQGHSQQEALAVAEKIGKQELPSGYHVVLAGNAQAFKDTWRSLMIAMLLGIIVAYMVLASQFDSFIHPLSVLSALPFSLSGAFFALYLGHQTLNLFSAIGLILLMGIVKKNSILLVDFTNQKRREGLPIREALIEACPVRLRPILMTSFATVAGAVPAALAIGPGAETRVPMALAIIGGVIVSMLLTLVVVPCLYLMISRLESKRTDVETGMPAVEPAR